MKTVNLNLIIIIFIVSLFAFNFASAQGNSEFLIDSSLTFVKTPGTPSSSILVRNKYYYNNLFLLSSKKVWDMDSKFKSPYILEYIYKNGQLRNIEGKIDGTLNFVATIEYEDNGFTSDSIIQTKFNDLPLSYDYKFSYTYDKSGKRTSISKFLWSDNQWLENSKTLFNYNNDGTINEKIELRNNSNKLVYSNKYNYFYDDFKRLIKEEIKWFSNENWEFLSYNDYTYKDEQLVLISSYRYFGSEVALSRVDSFLFENNLLVKENVYNVNDGIFYNTSRSEYFYNKRNLLTSLKRVEPSLEGPITFTHFFFYIPKYNDCQDKLDEIAVFPNPANEKLMIEFPCNFNSKLLKIEIRNSEGEMVKLFEYLNCEIMKFASLPLSEIPSGFYSINIYSDDGVLSNNFIITK